MMRARTVARMSQSPATGTTLVVVATWIKPIWVGFMRAGFRFGNKAIEPPISAHRNERAQRRAL